MTTERPRRRRAVAPAAVLLLAIGAAACSTDDGPPVGGPTVITLGATAGSTVAPEPSAATTDTTPATPATVSIDAASMLQQALDAMSAGSHFRTVVTVGDTDVLVAEGDRVGDGTRLTIWSSGTSVAYVVTPAGSWVFPEGGEWEPLDSAPATTDPLLALRTPTTVSGTSTDGVRAALVASVPATALGVPSDGTADVAVNVDGGSLVDVTYTAAVDGGTATVRSSFSPLQDPTPVTPPI